MREYATKPRALILEILSKAHGHISAKEIVEQLKNRTGSASSATVYRTLSLLEAQGLVKKMTVGTGPACYQYMSERACLEHFHLKCTECGELIHLSCEFLRLLENHILEKHAFTISSGKTVIYGKCAKCAGNDEKNGGCENSEHCF